MLNAKSVQTFGSDMSWAIGRELEACSSTWRQFDVQLQRYYRCRAIFIAKRHSSPPFFLPSLFSLFPNLHEKFIRRFVCRPTLAKPSIHATLSTSRNILIAAAAFQFASPPPMSRARWMRNDRVAYQFLMDILVRLRWRAR